MPSISRGKSKPHEGYRFGFDTKAGFQHKTNFDLELLYCIDSSFGTGSGYLAKVTRAADKVSG